MSVPFCIICTSPASYMWNRQHQTAFPVNSYPKDEGVFLCGACLEDIQGTEYEDDEEYDEDLHGCKTVEGKLKGKRILFVNGSLVE